MTSTSASDLAPLEREISAILRYRGRPDEPAGLEVLRRSPRDRTVRAAQGWALCWAAAIAAVFIPLLHFVLVPALLLAGPLVARARWQERATVRGLRGKCPGCGAAIETALNSSATAEIGLRCPACGRPLSLHLDLTRLDPDSAVAAPRAGA